jgi:spermidine synthase
MVTADAPPKRVLILGGGDGLALREVLAHPSVEAVTLVDLDPGMTNLSKAFPPLAQLSKNSFSDKRVRVINDDAMVWLTQTPARFDVVLVDFPDPNNFSLGKLYTTRFYALLREHLADGAVAVVQSTSPFMARQSFWCIARTMEAAGLRTLPYHAPVPSFGEWGYVLAAREPLGVPARGSLAAVLIEKWPASTIGQ